MGSSRAPTDGEDRPADWTTDLDSLALLQTVVRLGSLSRAGAAHHLSQPAASARIRRLERQLGITLLERRSSGSTPTPAGAQVAAWSSAVLDAIWEFRRNVEALRVDATGSLRLASSYTIAEHLLPRWLAAFGDRCPEVCVELEVVNSVEVQDRVLGRDADLGFVETTAALRPGLDTRDLGTDELVVVVGRSHPWWGRNVAVDATALAGSRLVLREAGSGTRAAFEDALRGAGVTVPRAALELGSTVAVKNAVADGSGVGVLSRLAVVSEQALGTLWIVPTEGIDARRALQAVWRSREQSRHEVSTFLHVVDEHMASGDSSDRATR
jgi:DNA-binding transcriptional LysR family regulator